jgi:hypothetical protein
MSGPAAVYVSPDDPAVLFQMDAYRYDLGIMWEHYAVRRELPATVRRPAPYTGPGIEPRPDMV